MYTEYGKVAMSVGYYYIANACGLLGGIVLSGLLYRYAGLTGCLWASAALAETAAVVSVLHPAKTEGRITLTAADGYE